jgi:hypothetical protein
MQRGLPTFQPLPNISLTAAEFHRLADVPPGSRAAAE